jgi:hypothetical protein
MLAWTCCVQVLRPWCHFELPDSDYLPAGRRNPELPGPSGVVEPLDPATKVGVAALAWQHTQIQTQFLKQQECLALTVHMRSQQLDLRPPV